MKIQYQVEGNVFSEINTNWLCAYAKESLIVARRFDTDNTGNAIEQLQLSDGRMFVRLVPGPRAVHISKVANFHVRNTQPTTIYERSTAHSH